MKKKVSNNTLEYYNQNSQFLTIRYESASVDNIHSSLESCFKRGSRLLELGTGSGRDASWLVRKGYEIVGIDGSEKMILDAYKVHPELAGKLSVGLLPDCLDTLTGPYDGIYSIAVLMHLHPSVLPELFSKILDLLCPGGRFYFSVSLLRDDTDENGFDQKKRYFASLTHDEWLSLASENGFREVESSINGDGLNRSGIKWLTAILEKL